MITQSAMKICFIECLDSFMIRPHVRRSDGNAAAIVLSTCGADACVGLWTIAQRFSPIGDVGELNLKDYSRDADRALERDICTESDKQDITPLNIILLDEAQL